MLNLFAEAIYKGATDRNDNTLPKIVRFLNCLFVLLFVTSMFFPLKDIFAKHLAILDVELISDAASVVWYCAIFLFWICTSITFILSIPYAILDGIENKTFYKKTFKSTYIIIAFFHAAQNANIGIFDYLALSSFTLLFIAPERLASMIETTFQLGNIIKNISMCLLALSAIVCAVSMLIYIVIKWIFPNYYEYRQIIDKIFKN